VSGRGVRGAGVACLGALGSFWACGGSGEVAPSSPGAPESPAATPGRFVYNGITHVSWWHDQYLAPEAADSRRALAATRSNWAGLLVTWYMERRDSSVLTPHPLRTPAREGLRAAIRELRGLGLKVMLKPHVDVEDGTWRGQIQPVDRRAWFASYREHLLELALLGAEEGVDMLCVGTELVTLSGPAYAADWTGIVREVRARFPGALTYAANGNEPGDEYASVSFWGALDVLGVDAYTPLTARTDPSLPELIAGWRSNRYGHDMVAAFRNWQAAWGKPFVFTEIGYRSLDGTNRAPWDFQASAPADPSEQAACYAAAYEVWSREPWMLGLFWWSWGVTAPGPGDTDYDPRGKPAEAVIRAWQPS